VDEIVRRIVAKVGLGFNLPMPKPVLFGLRGLQNEENVVAASRHLTPICRGKWRSLGEDIGTTDLLAHNQEVVGTFLRCKLLALKEVVGANGFEPSTSWSRTRHLNPINALYGVAYGTRSVISPLLVVPNLYLELVPKGHSETWQAGQRIHESQPSPPRSKL